MVSGKREMMELDTGKKDIGNFKKKHFNKNPRFSEKEKRQEIKHSYYKYQIKLGGVVTPPFFI